MTSDTTKPTAHDLTPVDHTSEWAALAAHHAKVRDLHLRDLFASGVTGRAVRVGEIARMLGGSTPSAEATAHADEMLRRAASPSI